MNGNRPADPMTKFYFWLVVFPLICVFLFLLYAGFAWSQDYEGDEMMTYRPANPMDWIAKYKGRRMGCCGHQDCIPVKMRLMNPRESGGQQVYDIEFYTKSGTIGPFYIYEFPARGVHVSENEFDYFCFVPKTFGSEHGHENNIYSDPCVENPQLECSNCFFFSPKI